MADFDKLPQRTRADGRSARPGRGDTEEPSAGMLVTERVRLLRPLDSGGMGSVWVAEHLTLGTEVAVKFVSDGDDDPTLRERLSREAQLAAKIDHPHAVRIFDHGHTPGGTPFIVMELLDGETLAERVERDGPIGLANVRRLVSQLAQVLAEAHALGIAHRDIKPHNIVLLSATDELFAKLLDFGIAKPFEEAVGVTLTAEGEVVGTPVYMAPEQLVDGQPADSRSDLWGLSVVAYQALTGERPFRGRTRAAIGAAMLLGRFEPVCTVDPELPATLDPWFAKNLSVTPDERHTTAKELAKSFAEAASGAPAGVASVTVSDGRLRVPDKLYGRDAEIATLLDAFAEAAKGRSRVVLVAGYSGIGKTSLVGSVHRTLAERGVTFVGGKFDQFNRGTPYDSLVQAFRELVRRILAGDDEVVWRERIVGGVGENLHALTDVIPELIDLIGPQPELEEVSPAEARNRFQNAIGRFVRAIASPERPLAIFLDDLQWADLPSIELIQSLSTDPESRHVLLIGAYRDNEVGDGHPLLGAIERMRSVDAQLDMITLGPLGEDAVLDLVSDATNRAPGRVRLAVACYEKTRGNAFFLKRFLESLTEKDLLRFDPEQGTWAWDLSEVQALPMNESVVDFVADEMRRMSEGTRKALGVASCIGTRFDLATLAVALGAERGAALAGLRDALESELVVPQTDGSWLTGPVDTGAGRMMFRFAHDRIRQAARSIVDDETAAMVHEAVGRFMLDHLEPSEREQRLFEVVGHLNRGTAEDLESTSSGRLRDLNLSAARRALASAAFEPAHGYYQEAHARLPDDAWDSAYEQTLAIHVEGARAAYLSGDHATMGALIESALEHSRELLDRVSAQEVKIHALVSQQRFADALGLAHSVLAELGFAIPAEPTGEEVQAAVGGSLALIQEHGAEAIGALPLCHDPRVVTAIRIQKGVMASAYLVAPQLMVLLTANIVRATIEHGVCKESPYGFSVLALVLNSANMLDVAAGVGDITLVLLDRVDDRSVRPSTLHVIASYVKAWTHPIRESIEAERHVFQISMDVGDLEYASWGLHVSMLNGFYGGVGVEELSRSCERDIALLSYHQQMPAMACSVAIHQAVKNLRGLAPDPSRLVGPDYDEDEHLATLKAAGFRGGVYVTATIGTFLRFLFRDLDAAVERADEGAEYEDGATATYNGVFWHAYRALALLGRIGPESEDRETVIAEVGPHLEQLRIWRAACDANHAHRVHLLEAEIARVEGRTGDAMGLYDDAIREARENQFVQEEAIANELAARFQLGRGSQTAARAYVTEACAVYEQWGASAKVSQMETEFEALLASSRSQRTS